MIRKTATPSARYGERGTVLNKTMGLRRQLFCAVLISLAVGAVIFGSVYLLGDSLLDKTVYGHSFAEQMSVRYFGELQDYVEAEGIGLNNLNRLNAWCSRGEKVYLTLYRDDVLIYESAISGVVKKEHSSQGFHPDMEDSNNEYILTLQDDTTVRAFLYYYAGDAFYYLLVFLSGIMAFLSFSLCFILLIGQKIKYIKLLREELDLLSGGQLEYTVTVRGSDELGELASGIDQMRRSIIQHQEVENQMHSANSQLITAMSHDLRTPLTSLLAYLEIIERKKYADEEQMYQLIRKSIGQTLRIKTMADQLFEYFFVYATEWETVEMERIEADSLFRQILQDYTDSLESKDLNVELSFSPASGWIMVNTDLLQRALDNLYSNLLKYADPKDMIWISYQKQENRISLSIHNGIDPNHRKKESSGIGLNTCKRVITKMGGEFQAKSDGDRFCVIIDLPLI